MDFKAAIFDMDGTLINSLFFWDIFWEKLGEKYLSDKNFRPDVEDEKRVRATMFKEAMQLVHEKYVHSASTEELLEFGNALIVWFYSEVVKIKDGIFEYLDYLKANNIKMCIASATAKDMIKIAVKNCSLEKYFDIIVSCDDIGVGKEKPDVYIKASEILGESIADCCVFEDSLIPAKTAKKAGFKTVGICDTHNNFNQDELEKTVDIYIAEGQTLKKLIK